MKIKMLKPQRSLMAKGTKPSTFTMLIMYDNKF